MVLPHTPLPRKVNWPTKKSLTVSVWRQYPKMKGFCLRAIVYILNQTQYIVSLIVRIVQESKVGVGVDPLTITPNNPLAKFLLPIVATLSSTGLEIIALKLGRLWPGSTTMVLPWIGDVTATWTFGLHIPLNQQAKKKRGGINLLDGVTNPDTKGKSGCLPHSGRKDYFWNPKDSLEYLLYFHAK